MAPYCIESNHIINTDNVKLIHIERKGKRLHLLEQLELKNSLKIILVPRMINKIS